MHRWVWNQTSFSLFFKDSFSTSWGMLVGSVSTKFYLQVLLAIHFLFQMVESSQEQPCLSSSWYRTRLLKFAVKFSCWCLRRSDCWQNRIWLFDRTVKGILETPFALGQASRGRTEFATLRIRANIYIARFQPMIS